MNDQVPLIIKH